MGEKDRFGFVPKNQILEHGIPSKQARPLGLLARKRGGETIHVPEGEPALRRLRQGKRTEDAAAVDPAERGEERDGGLVLAVGTFAGFALIFSFFPISFIYLLLGLLI
jgi:hypothetical protein